MKKTEKYDSKDTVNNMKPSFNNVREGPINATIFISFFPTRYNIATNDTLKMEYTTPSYLDKFNISTTKEEFKAKIKVNSRTNNITPHLIMLTFLSILVNFLTFPLNCTNFCKITSKKPSIKLTAIPSIFLYNAYRPIIDEGNKIETNKLSADFEK